MKNLILTSTFAICLSASAADKVKPDPLLMCEVAGAAYGAQKELVASIAARIASRAGLNSRDSKCGPIWREAYQIGQRTSQGNVGSQSEMEVVMRMQTFEAKLLDAVIDKVGF